MAILFDIMLPVFGLVLFGFVAARAGWVPDQVTDGIATFVFTFAVPALLLRTLGTAELPDAPPWGLFASFYLAAAIVYAGGMLVGRFVFDRPPMGCTLTGMGFAFGNTVMVGLPVTLAAYGDAGMLPFLIILSVHGLSFFTVTTILLETQRSAGGRDGLKALPAKVGRALVTNPILIGIGLGLAANLSGVGVPEPLERICRALQDAVTPCALFALGASLVRYGLKGRVLQALVVTAAKVVLLPLVAYGLARFVFDLDPLSVQVVTLTAALPVGVMVYVFSARYGTAQAISTSAVFLSTVASLFTLWALLALFQVR